jgi:cytochrome b involved in lipid metabolism
MTHNTASDCWIVVGTKVYSVGAYSAVHPGGIASITNLCGQDATTGFNTKNGAGSHSAGANTSLGGLFVGNLSGAAPTPPTTPPPAPVTPSYTATQIGAHKTASDCWIVIGTNVYSVGAYLMSHPGGAYSISKSCGKNASTAWGNKGGYGKTHSAGASTSLGGFLVGTLSGTAPAATPYNPAPTTGITASEIQMHNTATDCWMSIGTSVYSMGLYAPLHPGGKTKITNLCGKDGTKTYNGEHSGDTKVGSALGGMIVGPLSGPAPTTQFKLTVTKSGNGTVTSDPSGISCGGTCTANYNSGTSVTLTAVPTTKNVFSSWSSSCTGSKNPVCTVSMSKARSAKATFTASSTAP